MSLSELPTRMPSNLQTKVPFKADGHVHRKHLCFLAV
uniref:Uncharacterized protein n=1 Tax=Anguilla anguilla TaxID=7936 RepID=A0A0E9QMX7_ANGAN